MTQARQKTTEPKPRSDATIGGPAAYISINVLPYIAAMNKSEKRETLVKSNASNNPMRVTKYPNNGFNSRPPILKMAHVTTPSITKATEPMTRRVNDRYKLHPDIALFRKLSSLITQLWKSARLTNTFLNMQA
jgi:hypothetical protein